MTSEIYQRSTSHPAPAELDKADPEHQLYARFLPRRLTAEELRDSILQVSGEMVESSGGPPVFPDLNIEAALQPRHIMGGLAPPYHASPSPRQRNRRTIYTAQIRTLTDPFLQVLNYPGSDMTCERRDASIVAPQAFALFNAQWPHEMALALAARIRKTSDDQAQQATAAFHAVFSRSPSKQELDLCLANLQRHELFHKKSAPVDFKLPAAVVQSMIEELTGEPFEFEEEWSFARRYEYGLQPSGVDEQTRALADLCLVLLNSNEFAYVY